MCFSINGPERDGRGRKKFTVVANLVVQSRPGKKTFSTTQSLKNGESIVVPWVLFVILCPPVASHPSKVQLKASPPLPFLPLLQKAILQSPFLSAATTLQN